MTETTNKDVSRLEEKVIQQVEYYFGDLNLPRDKFLQEEVKKDDGWITLETMLKFNRLKNLSTDIDVIANALRKSDHGVIEVSEDGKKIRRVKELPEDSLEFWHGVKTRTVYVKRFPLDITLDELQDFFKKFCDIERVVMRYYKENQERNFKGSVFVTFPNVDEAKKFLGLESVKYGDEELTRLFQEQYFRDKLEETKKKRAEKKAEKTKATKPKGNADKGGKKQFKKGRGQSRRGGKRGGGSGDRDDGPTAKKSKFGNSDDEGDSEEPAAKKMKSDDSIESGVNKNGSTEVKH